MNYLIVTAAIIQKDDYLLITQRKADSHLGLKWEFPGGKLEAKETPEEGLKREIKEELDVDIEVLDIFKVVAHSYPEKDILLLAYNCTYISGEPKTIDCANFKWVKVEDLTNYDLAPADLPIVEKLITDMK